MKTTVYLLETRRIACYDIHRRRFIQHLLITTEQKLAVGTIISGGDKGRTGEQASLCPAVNPCTRAVPRQACRRHFNL